MKRNIKCPVCGEKELFRLKNTKKGKILTRSVFQCQTCGTDFKHFDFRGCRK